MTLPNNEKCQEVIKALDGDPSLTPFELSFINSNRTRTEFTPAQKEVVANLLDKYEV